MPHSYTRHRWQFGLRSLFVSVTIVAVVLAYHVNWIRHRHRFIAEQEQSARDNSVAISFENVDSDTRAPGVLWALCETGWWGVGVIVEGPIPAELTSHDFERLRKARDLFPEAKIIAVHHLESDGHFTTSLSEPNLD